MSQRLTEVQRANGFLNEWLELLKSGYETNNQSLINAFEKNFSKLSIKIHPENLDLLAIQLMKLKDELPKRKEHIQHLILFVERLNGQLRAIEQMQMRDENIEPKTFAKHLIFQFEPQLHEFHQSAEVKKAKMDWLLSQAFPEIKGKADAMKLMLCFSPGADTHGEKINRYVDFISSTTNKNDARFAAEVLLYLFSKDASMLQNITPIQIDAVIRATESAGWKKAIKHVSHAVTKRETADDKEESIQKMYREILEGTFTPPSKPREAIKELFEILHKNMVVGENPMLHSSTVLRGAVNPPPKPPRGTAMVSGDKTTSNVGDDLPTYAPPPPPVEKKEGGAKPSFLGDIEKRRKDVDDVVKPQDVVTTKSGGAVEVAPRPSFLDEVKAGTKNLKKSKLQVEAPTKSGGAVEVAPRPSFLDELKAGPKNLKKTNVVNKPKTSGNLFGQGMSELEKKLALRRQHQTPVDSDSDNEFSDDESSKKNKKK